MDVSTPLSGDVENSSLVTEILGLVQTLLANLDEIKPKVESIEKELSVLNARIDSIIQEAFPDGDLRRHNSFHSKGFFRRIFS